MLLPVPLVLMLGMMGTGVMSGGGMMSYMGGMMGGGSGAGVMSTTGRVLCAAWLALVAAALVFLLVLSARSSKGPADRDKAA